ncbi:MAG: putative phage tail protein [Bacteroidales bacterium]|jgi:uncharacterized protein YmfQ (DUF2313 family)
MISKIIGKILMAFAVELEKFEERVTALRQEAIPGLSRELLPEWETDLGLPDTCSPLAGTMEERARIAHAKYTGNYYGQNKEFFIEYAASLGANISIKEYSGTGSIFRVSVNRVSRMPITGIDGSRLWSRQAKYRWTVTVLSLDNVSLDYLKCRFNQLKPAHTEITWK